MALYNRSYSTQRNYRCNFNWENLSEYCTKSCTCITGVTVHKETIDVTLIEKNWLGIVQIHVLVLQELQYTKKL